jgi:hypothetical protein
MTVKYNGRFFSPRCVHSVLEARREQLWLSVAMIVKAI